MGKKKKKRKKHNVVSKTQLVPVRKGDIFNVSLSSYEIRCFYCKGEARCVDCGKAIHANHKMRGFRPVVAITNPVSNPFNRGDQMTTVIPISTKIHHEFEYPNTILLPANKETGLDKVSLAIVYDIFSVESNKFLEKNRRGKVSYKEWTRIEVRLREVLELNKDKILFGDVEMTHEEAKQIMREYTQFKKDLHKANNLIERKEKEVSERDVKLGKAYKSNRELIKEKKQLSKKLSGAEAEITRLQNEINSLEQSLKNSEK